MGGGGPLKYDDMPPVRRLAAEALGMALLGAILFAVFAVLLDAGRALGWTTLGAILGAAAALALRAGEAVLRLAFGEDPSLARQVLLGALVGGACGLAGRKMAGLAVGVAYGVVMAVVGAVILRLILRWKVIRDVRAESASTPPPVGRQVFRGSAVALVVSLSALGLGVAGTLLTLLFRLTPLHTVGVPVLVASLLGSQVEPIAVVLYMILKASRKPPDAARWAD